MGLARAFVDANVELSRRIDSLLPARVREDGNTCFIETFMPRAFQPNTTVYDLGGGSRPCISRDEKERLSLTIVGLDIAADELAAAPLGVYDRTIVHDLCDFVGDADADAIICQATMEHLPDNRGAMRALATTVKPGGRAFIFAPSRNAVFARLNMALPESLKRHLLFALFPHKAQGHDGFKAYYDHCTPSQIEALAREHGLDVEERRLFWTSSYFTVFAPAFVAWRLWQALAYIVMRDDAAESFAFILRKPASRAQPPGGSGAGESDDARAS